MRVGRWRAALRRFGVLASSGIAASIAIWGLAPASTESAVANGDTRTLHFYHTHTGETIDATFRRDGQYDPTVLAQLNHFLRDWRNNDEHQMDPRLFDAVWEAYRTAGATDRIQIYSAYRSPETNAALRRRSRAVAEHSQHMLGRAMDTTMPGFPMQRIREAGMKLQHGGVGWYPSSNFVHLDVGGVRSWPRMSYDQLARIFPDGKTVHIAADGRTLAGYDQARVEIAQHGGVDVPPAQQSSGFFAWLFGGGNNANAAREDEEDRRAAPVVVASLAPAPQQQQYRPQPVAAQTQAVQPPALAYNGATQDAAAARPTQIASLTPADAQTAVGFAGVMPLPPRRPSDLAEDDVADVPLPPVRPDALDRMQTASVRYSSTSAGVPTIHRSTLPAIITHGAPTAIPPQVLAFASPETTPPLRSFPLPVARPANLTKPMALRSARRHTASPIASLAQVATELTSISGPKLTGLRRAAKSLGLKASI